MMGRLHGKPAVVIGDITVACGVQCGFAFRAFAKADRSPVNISGSKATMMITGLDKTLIAEIVGTTETNTAAFYVTVDADDVPDLGEYVVELDPNPFCQPRLAQGLVRFDKTAQEVD